MTLSLQYFPHCAVVGLLPCMNPLMCFKVPGQEDLEELKEQEQQQQEQEQQLLQDHSDVEEDSEMNNYATEYSADK